MIGKSIKILSVEDNPADARLVQEILAEAPTVQFDLITVDLLSDALELLAKKSFDVILLDLLLPDSSGLDSFNKINTIAPHTPIIVLSGTSDEQLAIEAVYHGAQDYLVKGEAHINLLPRAISYAIERLRIKIENEREATLLLEAGGIFSSSLDKEKIFEVLARLVSKEIGDDCSIFKMTDEHLSVITAFRKGEKDKDRFEMLTKTPLPIEGSIAGFSVITGESILIKDTYEDQRFNYLYEHEASALSFICLPLIARGEVLGVLSTSTESDGRLFDVSDLRLTTGLADQAAAALENSNLYEKTAIVAKEWEETFSSIPDMLSILNQDFKIVRANKAFADAVEMKPEELVGKTCYEVIHGTKEPLPNCPLERAIKTNKSTTEEIFEPRLGKYLEISASPIFNEKGEIFSIVHYAKDITERKSAEEALRESEKRYRTLFEESRDTIYITSQNGELVDTNQVGLDLLGYTREEMMTLNILEIFIGSSQLQKFRQEIELKGYVEDYELKLKKKDGTQLDCLLSSTVRRADDGTILEHQGIIRDITEKKRMEQELLKSLDRLRKIMDGTIQVIVSTVEVRDPYTAGHQQRVADLSHSIATEMGLPNEQIDGIRMAGIIHDLGKLMVPAEILSRPGALSTLEFDVIKRHPQSGYEVLKDIEFPWPIAMIVLQHHERMDGSGYPNGLSGEEILLGARILAVADGTEAMAFHRPYRSALGINKALEEISKCRGVLYDPKIVDVCMKLFHEEKFKFKSD